MAWFVPDFETRSACDLKKAGAWRYAEDPTTDVLCLEVEFQNGTYCSWKPGEPIPPALAEAIERGDMAIAHNAQFEKAMWLHHMVPIYGWPDIHDIRWADTMARCANLQLPQALDRVASVLNLPAQKDAEGKRLTLSLSQPAWRTTKNGKHVKGMYPVITPDVIDRVQVYCRQDVVTQAALHRRVGFLDAAEHRVWLLDQKINRRGVRLDVALIRQMRKIVDEATVPLAEEFKRITGGLSFTQRDKIMGWVQAEGVYLPDMKKETLQERLGLSDEEDDEIEFTVDEPEWDIDLPAHVRRALYIRYLVGSASVKKLAAMEACVCSNGRAHGLLAYHAAGTGRWAGRLLQPQNFPRGSIKAGIQDLVDAIMTGDWEWLAAIFGPAIEVIVSSLRYALIASRGRQFIAGDYAQIEARVVLALAGQHDKCALLAAGGDPYCDIASQIYRRPITKADGPERTIGKNSVLGLGFQMGAGTFQRRYAKEHPIAFAEGVVQTYRKEWAPEVPPVWYDLERAALLAVWEGGSHEARGVTFAREDQWMTARLPSGRKLWYFDPKAVQKHMPWSTPEEPDVRRAWTYRATKTGQLRTCDAYGGLLTENVVQALARDILVHAMFGCEREGLPIVLTVHDEIVTEPEIKGGVDEAMLAQIMGDIPDWTRAMGVPVKAETWSGDRYRK